MREIKSVELVRISKCQENPFKQWCIGHNISQRYANQSKMTIKPKESAKCLIPSLWCSIICHFYFRPMWLQKVWICSWGVFILNQLNGSCKSYGNVPHLHCELPKTIGPLLYDLESSFVPQTKAVQLYGFLCVWVFFGGETDMIHIQTVFVLFFFPLLVPKEKEVVWVQRSSHTTKFGNDVSHVPIYCTLCLWAVVFSYRLCLPPQCHLGKYFSNTQEHNF